MFYGGLLLSVAVFFAWCAIKRENVFRLSDMLVVAIPLGHAFGRVGCFFYGCCYGRISDSAFAVSFPRGSPAWYEQLNGGLIAPSALESLPVLPTQLVEAAAALVLFAVLAMVCLRTAKTMPGFVSGCYFAGYALVRFPLEWLRGDPRAAVGPFSISQAISLGLLLGGFSLMAVALSRRKG